MDTRTEIAYIQGAKLCNAKREERFHFTIDTAVNQLIPPSPVGETVDISGRTTGLLLTH